MDGSFLPVWTFSQRGMDSTKWLTWSWMFPEGRRVVDVRKAQSLLSSASGGKSSAGYEVIKSGFRWTAWTEEDESLGQAEQRGAKCHVGSEWKAAVGLKVNQDSRIIDLRTSTVITVLPAGVWMLSPASHPTSYFLQYKWKFHISPGSLLINSSIFSCQIFSYSSFVPQIINLCDHVSCNSCDVRETLLWQHI